MFPFSRGLLLVLAGAGVSHAALAQQPVANPLNWRTAYPERSADHSGQEGRNSWPGGFDTKLQAPNDSVCFIEKGAYGGRLLRTTDRGLTWATTSPLPPPAGRLAFFSAQQGLVSYDSSATLPARRRGQVRVTTDGGATWSAPRPAPTGEVQFTSFTHGYVFQSRPAGGLLIYATTTSGQSWTVLDSLSGLPDLGPFAQIRLSIPSPNTAYLFYERRVRAGVSDGGALLIGLGRGVWRARPLPALSGVAVVEQPNVVRFTDDSTGALFSHEAVQTTFYTTTTGGRTWVAQAFGAGYGLYKAAVGDNQHYLYHVRVAGTSILPLKSAFGNPAMADYPPPPVGPSSRTHSNVGFENSDSRLLLLPSGVGWALGQGGRIYYSTDFGATFTLRTRILDDWGPIDIQFPDPAHGWVSTVMGDALLRTTDVGATWARVALPFVAAQIPVTTASAFPDADTLIVARRQANVPGFPTELISSADAGQTWTAFPVPANRAIYAISFAGGARRGLAVGENGTILRTADGGQSWQSSSSGSTVTLRSVSWTNDQTAFAAGEHAIIKTTDGGVTWQSVTALPAPLQPGDAITAVAFPTPQLGFATVNLAGSSAEANAVYRTTDGGVSWQPVTGQFIVKDAQLQDVARFSFLSPQHGWLNGYETQDGGLTWTPPMHTSTGLPVYVGPAALTDPANGFVLLNYVRTRAQDDVACKVLRYSRHFLRTAPLASTTLATGSTYSVAFTMEGPFLPTERDFRVELSNALGRFRPGQTTTIGQGPASPIAVTLPASLPLGTRYRLRVVRADGSVLGADNGQDLTLQRPTGTTPEAEVLAAPRLFPNPAQHAVTLAFADGAQPGRTVRLLDLAGRRVLAAPAAEAQLQLPLTGVPAGCYLVQTRTRDGRASTQRLIVQP